jgi:hypothetical protein
LVQLVSEHTAKSPCGIDGGGQNLCLVAVAVDQAGHAVADTEHAFYIVEQGDVGVLRNGCVMQARDGVVEQFQRAVAALQVGGFGGHARLQVFVELGQILRHSVEGVAQPAQFVLAGMLRAHREIALAGFLRAAEQIAQRQQHVRVHHIHGEEHHAYGDVERDAEYGGEQGDAVLGLVRQQFDQVVYVRHKVAYAF